MAIDFSQVSDQQKTDLNSALERLKTGLASYSANLSKTQAPKDNLTTGPKRPVIGSTDEESGSPFQVRRPVLSPIQPNGKGGTKVDPRSELNITGPSESEQRKIRNEVQRARRDRIRNVENIFDQELRGAETEGRDYEGRSRAINARAGILTSNLGEAQTEKVRSQTREVTAGINERKRQAILYELGEIDRIADEKILAKQKEAVTNRDEYMKYLTETQDTAKSSIQRIAAAGLSLDQLDEEDFQKLLDTSGMDELSFSAYYNANLPKAQQLDVKYQNLGNGNVGAFWVDPETNTIQSKQYKFPVSQGEDFQVASDGTPLIISTDENGKKTVRVADGFSQGQFRKPTAAEINGTGGGSTFKFGSADREVLIGGGFGLQDVDGIEADIEAGFSFDEIIANATSDTQKNALKQAFGVVEEEQSDLSRANVAKYYGIDNPEDTNKTGGFLGFGGKSPKDTIDGVMVWIEQQKAIGYTDAQIRSALEEL
jgi:hypothetical protein